MLVEFDDKSTSIIERNCEQLSVPVGDLDVENHCSVNWSGGNQYDGKIVFSGTCSWLYNIQKCARIVSIVYAGNVELFLMLNNTFNQSMAWKVSTTMATETVTHFSVP